MGPCIMGVDPRQLHVLCLFYGWPVAISESARSIQ